MASDALLVAQAEDLLVQIRAKLNHQCFTLADVREYCRPDKPIDGPRGYLMRYGPKHLRFLKNRRHIVFNSQSQSYSLIRNSKYSSSPRA